MVWDFRGRNKSAARWITAQISDSDGQVQEDFFATGFNGLANFRVLCDMGNLVWNTFDGHADLNAEAAHSDLYLLRGD